MRTYQPDLPVIDSTVTTVIPNGYCTVTVRLLYGYCTVTAKTPTGKPSTRAARAHGPRPARRGNSGGCTDGPTPRPPAHARRDDHQPDPAGTVDGQKAASSAVPSCRHAGGPLPAQPAPRRWIAKHCLRFDPLLRGCGADDSCLRRPASGAMARRALCQRNQCPDGG